MKYLILALALTGCRQDVKVSGGTTHKVEGEAKVVLAIDISICDEIENQIAKQDCIAQVLSILTKAQEQADQPANIVGGE